MAGTITFGMDIELVRQLATEMRTAAQQAQDILTRITGRLQSTPWEGPDRQKFQGEWEGPHTAALTNVINGLNQAADIAMQNAAQQEQASGQ